MATIFGANVQKSPTKEDNYSYGIIGENSEVFTENDVVTRDTGGALIVCPPSTAVLGVIAKTQTMSASNQTVEQVKPAFTPIDQDYEFLMGCNADLDVVVSPGAYYNIIGTTGIQQVDVAGGPVAAPYAVVMCTKVDPNDVGGTGVGSGLRQGLFKFVKVRNYHSGN